MELSMWYTWSKPRIFRAVQTDLVPVRPRPRMRHFMGTVRVHFDLLMFVGGGGLVPLSLVHGTVVFVFRVYAGYTVWFWVYLVYSCLG